MSPCAVLIGMPGSGKSSVAAELGRRLGQPVRDTDADIVAATGRTIPEIFTESGEAHFRMLEELAVERALSEHSGVLALGGGAIVSARTRAALARYPVIFLDISLAAGQARVTGQGQAAGQGRPLLAGAAAGRYADLYAQRITLYRACARWIIDTEELTVAQIADRIEKVLS